MNGRSGMNPSFCFAATGSAARSMLAMRTLPDERSQDSRDHAKRCGLAGAVRPKEPEQLTAGHVEVDGVYRREGSVPLGQRTQLDHWLLGGQHVDPERPHEPE